MAGYALLSANGAMIWKGKEKAHAGSTARNEDCFSLALEAVVLGDAVVCGGVVW